MGKTSESTKIIIERFKPHVFLIAVLMLATIFVRQLTTYKMVNQETTPDSRLYVGLARNIISGTGYTDTIRNDQIVPPIGHPLFLSVALIFGSLRVFDYALVYSTVFLLMFSVWVYTKNLLIALLSGVMILRILEPIKFYMYGIETSGIFTSVLVIFALTNLYRNKFNPRNCLFLSFALSLNILVRPVLLYLSTLLVLVLVIYSLLTIKTIKTHNYSFGHKMLVAIVPSLTIIFLCNLLSLALYQDERLTRGTYAGMNLYLSNNPYIPPNVKYKTAYFTQYIPKEEEVLFKIGQSGWKGRENALVQEAKQYIINNPQRASEGWIWRLKKYLGNDYQSSSPFFLYKFLVRLMFVTLIFRIILITGFKKIITRYRTQVLGIVISSLFIFQVSQLMLFSWTGERYLTYLIPYLIAGFLYLSIDLWRDLIGLLKYKWELQ
jgi:hypothetical protein